jgi:pectinesterase
MLGRPGSPHAKVAFINCQMDKHINSQGWTVQKNTETPTTVNFFEFNNTGAGANNSSRVKWSRQLTQQESTKFTAKNIFGSWTPK